MDKDEDYKIDEWTLHCIESRIKDLRYKNEQMRADAMERENQVDYLIFQNRILVLIELQEEINSFKRENENNEEEI